MRMERTERAAFYPNVEKRRGKKALADLKERVKKEWAKQSFL